MKIVNTTGQLIFEAKEVTTIDLSNLSKNIYILTVEIEKNEVLFRDKIAVE